MSVLDPITIVPQLSLQCGGLDVIRRELFVMLWYSPSVPPCYSVYTRLALPLDGKLSLLSQSHYLLPSFDHPKLDLGLGLSSLKTSESSSVT
jgi:hypothetical protein